MDKNTLRQHYKKLRAALSEEEQLELSLSITNRLLELPLWEKTYFHLFMRSAQHNEVDTEAILTLLQGKDKQVVIPRMEAENSLAHILLTDATLIRPNAWGIPEPVGGLEVPVNTLEVVFVPLLAYDKRGNRIGYGKGYYDRFLADCSKACLKIGLSFFPPEEHLPAEENDIPLDYCISPTKVYRFN